MQVTHPSRPGTTLEAQQLVHIDALPPVLILHMKRFCYDTSVGGVVKVGKQVRFAPELEIGNGKCAVFQEAGNNINGLTNRCRTDIPWNAEVATTEIQALRRAVSPRALGVRWALHA